MALADTLPPAPEPAPAPPAEKPSETSEEPEPQNALTKKFTEAEWKALKELRSDLPSILSDGYPDKPDAKTTSVTLWGVTIDPSQPKDAKVSVVLVHFLRARNLSVSAAREMLVATLRWRDEFNVEAAIKEEYPEAVFGKLGHIYGKDKEGRPVIYNVYGAHEAKEAFSDVQRFLRWRVALMEKSIALLDFETIDQTVQVHDYGGVSLLAGRDANSKQAASEASSIFGSHYPELLYKKFFVNVPSALTWIFWLFKPLISAATLAKMSVVGSGAHTIGRSLLPIIDTKELPKQYGGEANGF